MPERVEWESEMTEAERDEMERLRRVHAYLTIRAEELHDRMDEIEGIVARRIRKARAKEKADALKKRKPMVRMDDAQRKRHDRETLTHDLLTEREEATKHPRAAGLCKTRPKL